ncbi:MAG: hypothetical protein ACK56W_07955 [Pirellula sp.]
MIHKDLLPEIDRRVSNSILDTADKSQSSTRYILFAIQSYAGN